MAGGLVLGLLLGFAIGARVAGTPPGATDPATSPPILDVMPEAVSQRLRDAYYGGGGSRAVCIAAESVVCSRASSSQTARGYLEITRSLDEAEMAALTAVRVPVGRIIVAGDLGPADGAAIARVDQGGSVEGRRLAVANPDLQGIDYIDLGDLPAGTYLVAIGVPFFQLPTVLIEILVE